MNYQINLFNVYILFSLTLSSVKGLNERHCRSVRYIEGTASFSIHGKLLRVRVVRSLNKAEVVVRPRLLYIHVHHQ